MFISTLFCSKALFFQNKQGISNSPGGAGKGGGVACHDICICICICVCICIYIYITFEGLSGYQWDFSCLRMIKTEDIIGLLRRDIGICGSLNHHFPKKYCHLESGAPCGPPLFLPCFFWCFLDNHYFYLAI